MNKIHTALLSLALLAISGSVFAQEYVQGYYRRDGTYVQGYYRSSPNGTVQDNYSYEGNVNPYTGKVGTNRYIHDETSPYYEGPDARGHVGHADEEEAAPSYGPPPAPPAPDDDDADGE